MTQVVKFHQLGLGLEPQSVDPLNPQEGQIQRADGTSREKGFWQYQDGAWVKLGSGSDKINYVKVGAENTGEWTSDTDLIVSEETASPLRGNKSLKITKSAVNASGQSVSIPFTIDSFDQGKVLSISAEVKADSLMKSGDLKIEIEDVTNAKTIEVSNGDIISSETTHLDFLSFQTSIDSTLYNLKITCETAEATSRELILEGLCLGPSSVTSDVAFVSDWEEVAASGDWTGDYTGRIKRVGDVAHIQMSITNVTAATGNLVFNMPSGLSVDITKLANNNSEGSIAQTVGSYTLQQTGVNQYQGNVGLTNSTSLICLQGGTVGSFLGSSFVTAAAPVAISASYKYNISIEVPIVGWESGIKQSEVRLNREIFANLTQNAGGTLTANVTDIAYPVTKQDNTGSWDGSGFVAPETGFYLSEGIIQFSGNLAGSIVSYVDGTARKLVGSGTLDVLYISGTTFLKKGERLSFRSNSGRTLSLSSNELRNHLAITKTNSATGILAPTETVAAIYTADSGQSMANNTTTTVLFNNKEKDTHNAYNSSTGIFTAPSSGLYSVKGALRGSTSVSSSTGVMILRDNLGTNLREGDLSRTANEVISGAISTDVVLEAGDQIRIDFFQVNSTGNPRGLNTDDSDNYLSIIKVGK